MLSISPAAIFPTLFLGFFLALNGSFYFMSSSNDSVLRQPANLQSAHDNVWGMEHGTERWNRWRPPIAAVVVVAGGSRGGQAAGGAGSRGGVGLGFCSKTTVHSGAALISALSYGSRKSRASLTCFHQVLLLLTTDFVSFAGSCEQSLRASNFLSA